MTCCKWCRSLHLFYAIPWTEENWRLSLFFFYRGALIYDLLQKPRTRTLNHVLLLQIFSFNKDCFILDSFNIQVTLVCITCHYLPLLYLKGESPFLNYSDNYITHTVNIIIIIRKYITVLEIPALGSK